MKMDPSARGDECEGGRLVALMTRRLRGGSRRTLAGVIGITTPFARVCVDGDFWKSTWILILGMEWQSFLFFQMLLCA